MRTPLPSTVLSNMLATFLLNSRNALDCLFIAHLGDIELATFGTVGLLLYIPECFVSASAYALQSHCARYHQHTDTSQRQEFFVQCLMMIIPVLSLLLGLIYTHPSQLFAIFHLELLDHPGLMNYLHLRSWGFCLSSLVLIFRGYCAAQTDNHLFLKIICSTLCIQAMLDAILINGYGPLSPMGLRGSALAFIMAQMTAIGLYLWQCPELDLRRFTWPLAFQFSPSLLSQSTTMGWHNLFEHLGSLAFFMLVSFCGTTQIAAMHLTFSLLGIFPGMGMGISALSWISQHLDHRIDEIRQLGYDLLMLGIGWACLLSILLSPMVPSLLQCLQLSDSLLTQSVPAVRLMLATLMFHVSVQILRKCLEATHRSGVASAINIGVIYLFTLPACALFVWLGFTKIYFFWYLLLIDRLLKSVIMFHCWQHQAIPSPFFDRSPSPKLHKMAPSP